MNTTTQLPVTNDLRYTIDTKDKDGNTMRIKIRLNDECKNGHQDFAITADVWGKGKPKTDGYYIMGGCCHDAIFAAKPDLKIFIDLHLCDYKGIPMHAIENGFYHLREGFNNTKPDSDAFKKVFCDYYRVTPDQFDSLATSENKTQYATKLIALGVLKQWETQANEAISRLEEMTGKKFLVDSKKTQFNAPTPDEIKDEEQKQASGYYTAEAKENRKNEQENKLMVDLINKGAAKVKAINEEYAIKAQVLTIGGKTALDNCIYYTHNKTLAFNSRGSNNISPELIAKLKSELKLPEGVSFEDKAK